MENFFLYMAETPGSSYNILVRKRYRELFRMIYTSLMFGGLTACGTCGGVQLKVCRFHRYNYINQSFQTAKLNLYCVFLFTALLFQSQQVTAKIDVSTCP